MNSLHDAILSASHTEIAQLTATVKKQQKSIRKLEKMFTQLLFTIAGRSESAPPDMEREAEQHHRDTADETEEDDNESSSGEEDSGSESEDDADETLGACAAKPTGQDKAKGADHQASKPQDRSRSRSILIQKVMTDRTGKSRPRTESESSRNSLKFSGAGRMSGPQSRRRQSQKRAGQTSAGQASAIRTTGPVIQSSTTSSKHTSTTHQKNTASKTFSNQPEDIAPIKGLASDLVGINIKDLYNVTLYHNSEYLLIRKSDIEQLKPGIGQARENTPGKERSAEEVNSRRESNVSELNTQNTQING